MQSHGYWGVDLSNSDNADPALSNTTLTTTSDAVEGVGAMQIDYSVHNSEAWGGYTKIFHLLQIHLEMMQVRLLKGRGFSTRGRSINGWSYCWEW